MLCRTLLVTAVSFIGMQTVKEPRDGHLKRRGDIEETARGDPVHAFLVFLHVLKGDAKNVSQLFLAHAEFKAPRANALTQPSIHSVSGTFFAHIDPFTSTQRNRDARDQWHTRAKK